jgi:hypothetical protein
MRLMILNVSLPVVASLVLLTVAWRATLHGDAALRPTADRLAAEFLVPEAPTAPAGELAQAPATSETVEPIGQP